MKHDAERWKELERAFDAAMALPVDDRERHVETTHGTDPTFAAQLSRMLGAAEATGSFLETDAASFAGPAMEEISSRAWPTRLGPWHLIEEIGRGGMGVVFLAERDDDQFHQRAAVKLLRTEADERGLAQRLLTERQILASLQHPNIASILDGGTSPEGQPYLVMEYVEGQPLIEYCKARGLDRERRLDLFLQVCDAVEHAHQRLVVHCDLKPSNVLVDTAGRIKLLDFGIAKVLEPGGSSLAGSETLLFTPDYAAPEQLQGGATTTATDVYALGVLLYELLCDRRPHDFDGLSPSAIESTLANLSPLPPSRHTAPGLDGDLDLISLKALCPEPEERYGSARAFADDLRRHRRGLPVEARPATTWYRTRKFARRHRVAVVVASTLVLTSIAFTATLADQQRRTARARDEAEASATRAAELSDFLLGLFEASQPGAVNPDSIPVTRLLEAGETRARDFEHEPGLRAALLDAIGQARRGLGEYETAARLQKRATALQDSIGTGTSASAILTRVHLATTLQQAGELDAALAQIERAADDAGSGPLEGTVGTTRGGILIDLGRFAEAESLLAHSVQSLAHTRGEEHPATLHALNNLAMARGELGDARGVLEVFERILAVRRARYGERHQEVASALVNVAFHRNRAGDLAGTEAALREALAIRRELLGDAHPDLARVLDNLGVTLGIQGRLDEAEPLLRESLEMRESLLGAGHPSLATAWNNLAMLESRRGRMDQAVEHQQQSLRLREAALGPEHIAIAQGLTNLASFLSDLGRFDEAIATTARAIGIYGRQEGEPPGLASAYVESARALDGGGHPTEAESAAARAVGMERRAGSPRSLAYALAIHARILGRRGQTDLARAELDSALVLHAAAMGEDHPRTQWIRAQRDSLR